MLTHTLCFMFSGKAGVGKSTCASLMVDLARDNGAVCDNYSIATGVKNLAKLFGWDGIKDEKGRTLLQGIGQVGRAYYDDMWIKDCMERVEMSNKYPYDIITIDDWRFPNEHLYITNKCGLYAPIRIRIESPKREILKGTDAYSEVSEVSLDYYDFDYIIQNPMDRSIDSLKDDLSEILSESVVKYKYRA